MSSPNPSPHYNPTITQGLIATVHTADEGYEALAKAVVVLAANDYREEYTRMKLGKPGAKWECTKLERFFLGRDFTVFAGGVDGGYVLRKLSEEIDRSFER